MLCLKFQFSNRIGIIIFKVDLYLPAALYNHIHLKTEFLQEANLLLTLCTKFCMLFQLEQPPVL